MQRPRVSSPGTWVWVMLLLAGCVTSPPPHRSPEVALAKLGEQVLHLKFAASPVEAVALGLHDYDGQLGDWSASALENQRARLKEFEARLDGFPSQSLSLTARQDLRLLQCEVRHALWVLEGTRAPFRNPMTYAGALDVSVYLKRDFAPWPNRVRSVVRILARAPEVFAAARANLEPVLARPLVETAMEMANGMASFLEHDLVADAPPINDPELAIAFRDERLRAVRELHQFVDWLRTEKLPRADGSFAIGRAAFVTLLQTELIEQSPEELLDLAVRELAKEEERFVAAARALDPSRPAVEVFRAIQRNHPTETSLIPDTRRNLEAIRSFVLKRKLVTIPRAVRARVEPTLPPFRATSFASMETPGPFESRATEAYYYVTPTEPTWSAAQKDEWLTAFNYYTTDVVSIHEVYPGHYTQFLALNASRASRVAKVLSSYAFVEGWAHYTEQMMIEEGFAGPGSSEPQTVARYRLAQSDEALLRLCRLCMALRLHCQGATVEEAVQFFMDHCHYAEKPARQEAMRGTYDPGYGFYALGKLQLLKLRRDYAAQAGAEFSLLRFHDEVLRHGAPPIRLLREILLRDPKQWEASL